MTRRRLIGLDEPEFAAETAPALRRSSRRRHADRSALVLSAEAAPRAQPMSSSASRWSAMRRIRFTRSQGRDSISG